MSFELFLYNTYHEDLKNLFRIWNYRNLLAGRKRKKIFEDYIREDYDHGYRIKLEWDCVVQGEFNQQRTVR